MPEPHCGRGSAASSDAHVTSVGDGSDARTIVHVGAWELVAWVGRGDEEPRIRDVDLAARLQYERPAKIRDLIKSMISRGKLSNVEVFPAPGKTFGGRPAMEFWLTEAQALKVAAKSETEPADAILDEMIHVFELARRGLLPSQAPVADLGARDVMVAMVSEVVGQMVAPLLKRLGDLDKALAQRHEGMITAHQAEELRRSIGAVARDYYDLGDYKNMRAARSAIHQHVMAASEWGGTGRVRWAMPAGRYAVATATLRALQKAADRRLKGSKKPPMPPRGQLTLPVDKPN